MSAYSSMEEIIIVRMMTFIMTLIFACLLSLASQVLLAFAAYNDAKARGNSDPVMWALLVGILGWIPGIVYLCVRNNTANRLMICAQCGFTHRIAEPVCPQCRSENPYSAPFHSPLAPRQSHNAKLLLIWGIVTFAIAMVLIVIGVVALVNGIVMAGMY